MSKKTKELNEKYELAWGTYKKADQLVYKTEMALFVKLGKKHIIDELDRLADELEKDESEEIEYKIDDLLVEHSNIIENASCIEKDNLDDAMSKVNEAIGELRKYGIPMRKLKKEMKENEL